MAAARGASPKGGRPVCAARAEISAASVSMRSATPDGIGVAMVGSLFSAVAWENITYTAGEVRRPERDIALSLAMGTALVSLLYILANVTYLAVLPMDAIRSAPHDRVATAALSALFGAATVGLTGLVGKRMAGQTGGETVKMLNLQVVKIMSEHNIVLIKGSVPGARGSYIILEK